LSTNKGKADEFDLPGIDAWQGFRILFLMNRIKNPVHPIILSKILGYNTHKKDMPSILFSPRV